MLHLVYFFLIFSAQLTFADIFIDSANKIKASKNLSYSKMPKYKKLIIKNIYLIAIFILIAFIFCCTYLIISIFLNKNKKHEIDSDKPKKNEANSDKPNDQKDKNTPLKTDIKNKRILECGITNNGSVCYANSAMQIIFNNQYMIDYIESIDDANVQSVKAQYENYTKQLYEIYGLKEMDGKLESLISVDEIFSKLKTNINQVCKKLRNHLNEYDFSGNQKIFTSIENGIKNLETNLNELVKEMEKINQEFKINKYNDKLLNYTKFISKKEDGSFKNLLSKICSNKNKNNLGTFAYLINEDKIVILSLFASALGRIGIKFNKNNQIECLNKIASSLLSIGDDIEEDEKNEHLKIRDVSEERKKLIKLDESNKVISLMYAKKMNYSDYEAMIKNLKKFVKETDVKERGKCVINILKAMKCDINIQDDSSSFAFRLLYFIFVSKEAEFKFKIQYTCEKCLIKYNIENDINKVKKQPLLFLNANEKPSYSMTCENCLNKSIDNIFNLLSKNNDKFSKEDRGNLFSEFAFIKNMFFYENPKFDSIKKSISNLLNLNEKTEFIEYAEKNFSNQNNFQNLLSYDVEYLKKLFSKDENYHPFYYLCFFLRNKDILRFFNDNEREIIKCLDDNLLINLNPLKDKNFATLKTDTDLPYILILVEFKNSQDLNILNFKNENGENDFVFELQSFSARIGSTLRSGHYVAYFQKNNEWKVADDTFIFECKDYCGHHLSTYKNNFFLSRDCNTSVQAAFYMAKNPNYKSR